MSRQLERFSVDAKLLRELGERLVGRPHLALAELVKNSFDADARTVEITFQAGRIIVVDDGHGMSHDDFSRRWMRIGTAAKDVTRHSPELRRTVTGSKGVGRLSVQTLARQLAVTTVGLRNPTLPGRATRRTAGLDLLHREVRAQVDWDHAVDSDDLTSVTVPVEEMTPTTSFVDGSSCGTRFELTGLVTTWDAAGFRRLAQELWSLQPPLEVVEDDDSAFSVRLESSYPDVVEEFSRQMRAILDIWRGKVQARLLPEGETPRGAAEAFGLPARLPGYDDAVHEEPTDLEERRDDLFPERFIELVVELRDGASKTVVHRVSSCRLADMTYEVRIFDLRHRQPLNIAVSTARSYLDRFGGVNIYDGPFRLPYSGSDDWLGIEGTHSRRMSNSRLVPSELQIRNGLHDLPTNRRLFGSVRVSTTHEAQVAEERNRPRNEILAIQVTRDRLVDNAAYQQLQVMVRAGLDLYAMEYRRFAAERARRRKPPPTRPPSSSFRAARDAIAAVTDSLPPSTSARVNEAIDTAIDDAESLEASNRAHASLLGALATAGMVSMAYEHEMSKHVLSMRALATRLDRIADGRDGASGLAVAEAADDIRRWLTRAEGIRTVFKPLMDEETRTLVGSFPARALIEEVARQLTVLARATIIDVTGIPAQLRLLKGSYPAWSAIFQNLFVNAFNAVLDTPRQRVDVDGGTFGNRAWVRVQDTGSGIDLDDAERLFEPFERGRSIDPQRAALGLGGGGLGLTIVRMISEEIGCSVRFTQPDNNHATAVTVSWTMR